MPKPSSRHSSKPTNPLKTSIDKLKKEVRQKVARGQALVKGSKRSTLEAREIQIKIAALETKAAKASSIAKKTLSPESAQTLQKQTEALKRKLKQ